MAQAKRKRWTKHRGNAAGVAEVRGRTSRPASPEEQKKKGKEQARNTRAARQMKPPTLKGSAMRAGLAAAFMFVFLAITESGKKGGSPILTSAVFALFAFIIYMPAGYYLENYMYKRRLAKQGRAVKR